MLPPIPRADRRRLSILSALAAVLLLIILAAAASGAMAIPWHEVPALLFSGEPQDDATRSLWRNVLLDVRLPRVLLALVTGGGLALGGAAMQALFRNPLADPGLIGISAGGAMGAVIAIVLGFSQFWEIAAAAFAGALAATALAWQLGRRHTGVGALLMAGIALNALCGSVVGLFVLRATDDRLRSLTFWTMGSLGGASWPLLAVLVPWVGVLSILLLRHWRACNALLLGEREAAHLGYGLTSLRRRIVLCVTLLVAPLVAVTGIIGFVGLVVPHLLRIAFGADHRLLLPACVLAGGAGLTLADWGARTLAVPAELPIGILTSLIGGPFLLWLLLHHGRKAAPC